MKKNLAKYSTAIVASAFSLVTSFMLTSRYAHAADIISACGDSSAKTNEEACGAAVCGGAKSKEEGKNKKACKWDASRTDSDKCYCPTK